MGGRQVGRIERALLANDGKQHRVADLRSDGRIPRHAHRGKRVVFERQAAGQRGLPHVQHGARVLMLLRQFAERGKRTDVVELAAEVRQQRNDERALVESIENFQRAH